jgi:hypothetical protein
MTNVDATPAAASPTPVEARVTVERRAAGSPRGRRRWRRRSGGAT